MQTELTLKLDQAIRIGGNIKIDICSLVGAETKLGVDAPEDLSIRRDNPRSKNSAA